MLLNVHNLSSFQRLHTVRPALSFGCRGTVHDMSTVDSTPVAVDLPMSLTLSELIHLRSKTSLTVNCQSPTHHAVRSTSTLVSKQLKHDFINELSNLLSNHGKDAHSLLFALNIEQSHSKGAVEIATVS